MRLLIAFGLWSVASFAASLSVSPSYLESSHPSGQVVAEKLLIFNSSEKELTVQLSVGDFWYDDQNKRSFPNAGSTPYSIASWIALKQTSLTVAANSSLPTEFVISIPESAPASGYATIFVERAAADANKSEGGAVGISLRIAVPILYRHPDRAINTLSLKTFEVQKPNQFRPLVLKFLLQNPDDVYVFPRGNVLVVKSDSKALVGKGEMEKERILLPKQDLPFELPLSMEPKKGKYEGLLTLFYGDKNIVRRFEFSIP